MVADGSAPRGSVEPRSLVDLAGGTLLVLATLAALVLANTSGAGWYSALLEHAFTLDVADFHLSASVHAVVADGLMTIFFFSVGLEIRRELHDGALAGARRAALPVVAALGGMVVPALVYFAFNQGTPAARGWGIPTATDIAFAIAALSLLRGRGPATLRVLLLALAIIDDIGGVLLIAFFYSGEIVPRFIAVTAIGIVLTLAMRANGFRRPWAYLLPGTIVWVGLHEAGIHPTMAGVLMGLLAPPQRDESYGEVVSPSERLQQFVHPWVALVVMPAFAFVSAGVLLDVTPPEPAIALGVALGLVVGKPVGIFVATTIAARAGLVALPPGLGPTGLWVLGLLAGIGFTVALFIGELALPDPSMLASAKLGILAGSTISLLLALALGRIAFARSRGGAG